MGKKIEGTPLRIMEQLWLNQYPKGSPMQGLSARALADVLGVTVTAINAGLRILMNKDQADKRLIFCEAGDGAPKEGGKKTGGGKKGAVYLIDYDYVITWPSTAKIVFQLFQHDGGRCKKSILMNEILTLGMTDPETGKPFDEAVLTKQLNFIVSRGYFKLVPEHESDDRLEFAPRERVEHHYLEFLISRLDGPPAC